VMRCVSTRVVYVLLVCNWPHSVGQNHFFVQMLFNRDSAIQKCFQKTAQFAR
jgi:hypothetical protein